MSKLKYLSKLLYSKDAHEKVSQVVVEFPFTQTIECYEIGPVKELINIGMNRRLSIRYLKRKNLK